MERTLSSQEQKEDPLRGAEERVLMASEKKVGPCRNHKFSASECEEKPLKDFNEGSDIISMSSSFFQEECIEGKKENGTLALEAFTVG